MSDAAEDSGQRTTHNQVGSANNAVLADHVENLVVGPDPGPRKPRVALIVAVAVVVVVGVATGLVVVLRQHGTTTADSGPPVGVVVQNQADPAHEGGIYALPGTIDHPPAEVTVGPQLAALANAPDAAPVSAPSGLALTLVLTGQYHQSVVITGLRAVVRKHQEPLAGTLFYAPAQGVVPTVDGCLFLDSPPRTLRQAATDDGACTRDSPSFFAGHDITLADGEHTVINLSVSATSGYYQFALELTVVANGQASQVQIENGANPFQLTTYAPTYQAVYAPQHGVDNVLYPIPRAVFCPHSCTAGPYG